MLRGALDRGYMQNKTLKHLCKCFILHVTTVLGKSKTETG